ncbi:MAG: DarT ssDNA thymidine ADP-ribosyltransferase family protein [Alphaproteobacteria bacterium]
MLKDLNPEKALIFRIIHRENMPWILEHGLHCKNSDTVDPHYVTIGNTELIDRRTYQRVPCHPGGTLSGDCDFDKPMPIP